MYFTLGHNNKDTSHWLQKMFYCYVLAYLPRPSSGIEWKGNEQPCHLYNLLMLGVCVCGCVRVCVCVRERLCDCAYVWVCVRGLCVCVTVRMYNCANMCIRFFLCVSRHWVKTFIFLFLIFPKVKRQEHCAEGAAANCIGLHNLGCEVEGLSSNSSLWVITQPVVKQMANGHAHCFM